MKKWNYLFNVPEQKRVRMIVHTDCKNEADDQFALAHHLMTPKFKIEGIIAGHFNLKTQDMSPHTDAAEFDKRKKAGYYATGTTAQASLEEVEKVLDLMGVTGICPVVKGSELPMVDEKTAIDSPGAQMIIREAMREDDDRPLFIGMLGGITDLACAILLEPRICERMTAIWIGGGEYPNGGDEFNLANDINAANVVFKSNMPVWQVPKNVYKEVSVSLAELQLRVRPYGKIGNYIFTYMNEVNQNYADFFWPHGEIWGLGDNPTVSVLMEEVEKTDIYDVVKAPSFNPDMTYDHSGNNREIRVYNQANARLCMEDFYAKLQLNYPNPED